MLLYKRLLEDGSRRRVGARVSAPERRRTSARRQGTSRRFSP